jgi:hypothetical protein
MEILIVVLALVVLDVGAQFFGTDSRLADPERRRS